MKVKDDGLEDAELFSTTYNMRASAKIQYNNREYNVPYTYEETQYESASCVRYVNEILFDEIGFENDISEDEKNDFLVKLEEIDKKGEMEKLLWG